MNSVTDNVEQQAPELAPLVKAVKLSLKKHKLEDHTARVVLVLDISLSMNHLYKTGKVQQLVAQSMALGLQFDDDGEIDVFAFGTHCHYVAEYGLTTYKECVNDILSRHPLENSTDYEKPLRALIEKYRDSELPVYVQFVTDGETQSPERAERVLREMSSLGIFVQFMALGVDWRPEPADDQPSPEPVAAPQPAPAKKGLLARLFGGADPQPAGSGAPAPKRQARKAPNDGFKFLASLDELEGRKVDNAGFFGVADPARVESDEMYRLLMSEYPQWLKDARAVGILK